MGKTPKVDLGHLVESLRLMLGPWAATSVLHTCGILGNEARSEQAAASVIWSGSWLLLLTSADTPGAEEQAQEKAQDVMAQLHVTASGCICTSLLQVTVAGAGCS
jgi:hypothetical protein